MFSKRQKIILSYIVYNDLPIKIEQLADIIDVSIYTIRTEAESINVILSEQTETQMVISKKGQCFIKDRQKEAVRKLLVNPVYVDKNNVENHIIWDRIYTIMGMLSFEPAYVSMGELAERLYVSKATINLDITEIKRIVNRIPGINFIVSSTKGMKFTGNEENFRYLLAKLIVQGLDLENTLQYAFPNTVLHVQRKYANINKVLSNIMVKHQFVISGKSFGLVCANLLICAIRDQLAYPLTYHDTDKPLSSMSQELRICLQNEAGITFTDTNMLYIQKFILEQSDLHPNERFTIADRDIVSLFTRVTKTFFQIDLENHPKFKTEFTFYINQLNQRVRNGHDYANFFKGQINRIFPMTASIVAYCQRHLTDMGIIYSEAELAYITLFLGRFVESEGPILKLLFISDEHTALTNWLVAEVQRLMGSSVDIVDTIPRYLFEENSTLFLKDIDVILTTEPIQVNDNQNVIFIQALFGRTERKLLGNMLDDYLQRSKVKALKQIENMTIGPNHFMSIPKMYESLDQCVDYMLKHLGQGEEVIVNKITTNNCFIPTDTKIARVSLMTEYSGQSKMLVGTLPNHITYRDKPIHVVILSIYHKQDYALARQYYQTIRFLMERGNQLEKVKDYMDFKKMLE